MLQVLAEDQSLTPLGMALEKTSAKVTLAIWCIGCRASPRKILAIAKTGPDRSLDIIEARSLLSVAGEAFCVGGHGLTTPKDVVVLTLNRKICLCKRNLLDSATTAAYQARLHKQSAPKYES